MKIKRQLTRAIAMALFAVILLVLSPALFAQVKIGANPTVIGANNSLEVEASTAGNKMSVDKATGKITIADASQGVDKVLTSDANGVATWQKIAVNNVAQFPKAKLVGGTTNDFVNGVRQLVVFPTLQFSELGMTKVGSGIQVPKTGYYQLNISTNFSNAAGCNGTAYASSALELAVNGSNNGIVADDKTTMIYVDNFTLGINSLIYLNANDVVTVYAFTNYAAGAGCTNKIIAAEMSLNYQP